MKNITSAALLAVSLTGCFDSPISSDKSGVASQKDTPGIRQVEVKSDEGGVLTAELSPLSGEIQTIQASADSAISGSNVTFPPGAIAVATDITVQQGADIAESVATETGLAATDVKATSAPVLITSSVAIDAAQPFTIGIALPQSAALTQGSEVYYTVMYVVDVVASGQKVSGLVPTAKISIKDGKAYFETKNFGVFQVAQVAVPVIEEKKLETKIEARPATEVATGPDAVFDSVKPVVIKTGEVVTISGKNFRKSMTLALAGKSLTPEVKSDVSASFSIPAGIGTGFRDLEIKQDTVSQKMKLFTRADSTGLPLITLSPGGVCAGVSYIDGNGTQQTGTRVCEGTMNKSTYDTNQDGIVDNAAYALKAGFADQAAYAPGKAGASIAATASLNIQEDGTFFDVTGSNVSITGLSSRPAGTRITLRFNGANTLVHTDGTTKLLLRGEKNTVTISSDVFDFLSLGNNRWVEMSRYQVSTLVIANMSATPQPGFGDWTSIDLIPSEELLDRRNEYNPATGHFTASVSGYYSVQASIRADHSNYSSGCSGGYLYLYVKKSGASSINSVGQDMPCLAGYRTAKLNYQNFWLNAGDSIYLAATVSVSGSTGTVKNHGTDNMLKIMRVVD